MLCKIVANQLSAGNVHISALDIGSRQLEFTWNLVAPDCPAIHYNISASNCGSCPTTTNHNTVTCTGVPTSGNKCKFMVQPVACGHASGNFNYSVYSITIDSTKISTSDHPNKGIVVFFNTLTK